LYLGAESGTSLDRANALRRLGHRIEHVDLRNFLPRTAWVYPIIHKFGGHLLSPWILHSLPLALQSPHYDLCYVDGGELVTPRVIRLLRNYATKIINYNIDDPLGNRDGAKSKAYRRSVAFYDFCVVMRSINVSEAKFLGAKHVIHVNRSSDEVTHAPRVIIQEDRDRWNADVLFLGTWFPERGPFLSELVNRGVPLTIRGANWHKAPEWPKLRSSWKGGPLQGDDYAKAIQCAKVNLGLLSKGNRDLHTTRSMEIPALGGLLCAERTAEHLDLYIEGKEALFWDSVEECAAACSHILTNEELRKQIAAAGQARSVANGNTNENVMRAIVEEVRTQS
jgi:hypothetical protein